MDGHELVKQTLDQIPQARADAKRITGLVKKGGRIAILTFHSLEDRIVKQRFASWRQGCTCPREFPVCVCGKTPAAAPVGKPLEASAAELEENPRSRSAKLRCIERLHEK